MSDLINELHLLNEMAHKEAVEQKALEVKNRAEKLIPGIIEKLREAARLGNTTCVVYSDHSADRLDGVGVFLRDWGKKEGFSVEVKSKDHKENSGYEGTKMITLVFTLPETELD